MMKKEDKQFEREWARWQKMFADAKLSSRYTNRVNELSTGARLKNCFVTFLMEHKAPSDILERARQCKIN